MFDDHFSFGPLRRSSIPDPLDTSRSVSPCSHDSAYSPSPFSVTDLAAQFASQRIQRRAQICYDSCEAYANTDDNDSGWIIPTLDDGDDSEAVSSTSTASFSSSLRRSNTPPSYASASRRTQRQLSTRLLCSASHHRDIATLVARMVDSQEQCSLAPSPTIVASPSVSLAKIYVAPRSERSIPEAIDEGYDSGGDSSSPSSTTSSSPSSRRASGNGVFSGRRIEYRRASDLSATGACVRKKARLRRDRVSLHRRTGTERSTDGIAPS